MKATAVSVRQDTSPPTLLQTSDATAIKSSRATSARLRYSKSLDSGYHTSLDSDDDPEERMADNRDEYAGAELVAGPASENVGSSSMNSADASSPASPAVDISSALPLAQFIPYVLSSDVQEEDKRQQLTVAFIRAASSGDVGGVRLFLRSCKEHIDVNGLDEDGSCALIYACAIGHEEVVGLLLGEGGCSVDIRDKHGWTPLMWACANNYYETARLLVDMGASKDVQSYSGRSIKDLVGRSSSSRQIVRILDYDGSDTASLFSEYTQTSGGSSGSMYGDEDDRLSIDEYGMTSSSADRLMPFEWDVCALDQMLVFDEDRWPVILHTIVHKIRPVPSRQAPRPLPANILYLLARYAFSFHSEELGRRILQEASDEIERTCRAEQSDAPVLAHWLANASQLLYYLKRDGILFIMTLDAQAQLSELVHNIYTIFIHSTTQRILNIMDAALIDHKGDESRESAKFENAFVGRVQRKGLSTTISSTLGLDGLSLDLGRINMGLGLNAATLSSSPPPSPPPAPSPLRPRRTATATSRTRKKRQRIDPRTPHAITPKTLTNLLTSTLSSLAHAPVHPHILNRATHQILHFLCATLLNTILETPLLCSRSSSLRLLQNLSHLTNWIRDTAYRLVPASKVPLQARLKPVLQLLKFLGVASSLHNLEDFLEIKAQGAWSSLTFPQLSRAVSQYRYEVEEDSISPDIESYLSA
ncbi:hypothetical protein HDU85_006422, partial [Gaertneriomyces sp. JEL0708]